MRPFFTVLAALPILTHCSIDFIYENRKFFKQRLENIIHNVAVAGGRRMWRGAE